MTIALCPASLMTFKEKSEVVAIRLVGSKPVYGKIIEVGDDTILMEEDRDFSIRAALSTDILYRIVNPDVRKLALC